MKFQSYKNILCMISDACTEHFLLSTSDMRESIIDCATRIYIEQMRIEAYGPTGYSEQYEAQEDLDNYE